MARAPADDLSFTLSSTGAAAWRRVSLGWIEGARGANEEPTADDRLRGYFGLAVPGLVRGSLPGDYAAHPLVGGVCGGFLDGGDQLHVLSAAGAPDLR